MVIRNVDPEFTVLSERMFPDVSSLRTVLLFAKSITGVPEALALTVQLSCFADSCVVSVLVSVYALTAAAMEAVTS